jgi:hypothetical protein
LSINSNIILIIDNDFIAGQQISEEMSEKPSQIGDPLQWNGKQKELAKIATMVSSDIVRFRVYPDVSNWSPFLNLKTGFNVGFAMLQVRSNMTSMIERNFLGTK